MLTYKATQSSYPIVDSLIALPEEDDSDWEYLTKSHGEHYDGGSESSPSYFSDDEREMSLSPFPLQTRWQYGNRGLASGRGEEVDYLQDDVEVEYFSTKKVPPPTDQGESPIHAEGSGGGKYMLEILFNSQDILFFIIRPGLNSLLNISAKPGDSRP